MRGREFALIIPDDLASPPQPPRLASRDDFEPIEGPERVQTRMRDAFDFTAPLGFLGTIAERLFLARYMRAFLLERNRVLRAAAEGADWQRYLLEQH